MAELELDVRQATEADLPAIVALLADDPLGALREETSGSLTPAYRTAFEAISRDPNHEILVADLTGTVGGVLQLSFLPHLTYRGGWRGQIEGVRVAAHVRSRGVGQALVEAGVERARARGCHLVQLTTDRRRPEAVAFYHALGFESSHVGMKLHFGAAAREP